jgi:hypothetical protein
MKSRVEDISCIDEFVLFDEFELYCEEKQNETNRRDQRSEVRDQSEILRKWNVLFERGERYQSDFFGSHISYKKMQFTTQFFSSDNLCNFSMRQYGADSGSGSLTCINSTHLHSSINPNRFYVVLVSLRTTE